MSEEERKVVAYKLCARLPLGSLLMSVPPCFEELETVCTSNNQRSVIRAEIKRENTLGESHFGDHMAAATVESSKVGARASSSYELACATELSSIEQTRLAGGGLEINALNERASGDIPDLKRVIWLPAASQEIVFFDVNRVSTNVRAINRFESVASTGVPELDSVVPPTSDDSVGVAGEESGAEDPAGVASCFARAAVHHSLTLLGHIVVNAHLGVLACRDKLLCITSVGTAEHLMALFSHRVDAFGGSDMPVAH